jgi:hypothetical protein
VEKREFMKSVQGLLGVTIRSADLYREVAVAPELFSLCHRSFLRWMTEALETWRSEGKLRGGKAPGLLRRAIRDGEPAEWATAETYARLKPDEDMEAAEHRWRDEARRNGTLPDEATPKRPVASADELRHMIAQVAADKRLAR